MKRLLLCAGVLFLMSGAALAQYKVKRVKGDKLNDGVIESQNLLTTKVLITDFLGEINNNFTPEERKRGLRGPYYTRFNLRDSKMRCLVSKYDLRNYTRLAGLKKNDRITVVGRIEQLAMGLKRFSNPYYILRVSHLESGWKLEEDQEIFVGFDPGQPYEDVAPQDVGVRGEEYAGEYLRIKDRFSIASAFFTTFEKDINLNGGSALKFYLENCATPCYLPNTEPHREALAALRSGDPVTVCGRLNLVNFEDEALLLFSVSSLKRVQ